MDYLKNNLMRKVSRLSRRRKAEKTHHPYRTRTSERAEEPELPEMQELPSPDSSYTTELAGIKLRSDRSFSGLDFSNTVTPKPTTELVTTAIDCASKTEEVDSLALKNTEFIPLSRLLATSDTSLARSGTSTPLLYDMRTPDVSSQSKTDSSTTLNMSDCQQTPATGKESAGQGVTSLTGEMKALGQSAQKRKHSVDLQQTSTSLPGSEETCSSSSNVRHRSVDDTPLCRVKRAKSMKEFTLDFALGRLNFRRSSQRPSFRSQRQLSSAVSCSSIIGSESGSKLRPQPVCTPQDLTHDSLVIDNRPSILSERTTPTDISLQSVQEEDNCHEDVADELCDDGHDATDRLNVAEKVQKTSALETLFPSGVLPALVINPLQSPCKKQQPERRIFNKQNATTNLFQRFRKRAVAGKSRLFSSLRGRNERHTTQLEHLSETTPSPKSPVASDENGMESPTLSTDSVSRRSFPHKVLLSPDRIDVTLIGTPDRNSSSSLHDSGVIPPPTPFRMLVTTDTDNRLELRTSNCDNSCTSEDSSPRTISNTLKKEIEMSLLHWPSMQRNTQVTRSLRVRQPTRSSKTLPSICRSGNSGLSIQDSSHLMASRPLSWSYDTSQPLSTQLTPHHLLPSSYSNNSLPGRKISPLASRSGESPVCAPSSLCDSKSSIHSGGSSEFGGISEYTMSRDTSFDTSTATQESEEFMDAVSALHHFEKRQSASYARDSRRMSQPHPIKSRSRLRSDDSMTSVLTEASTTSTRRVSRHYRSKSEPARLVHEDIRQNFHKDLSKICPAVGDIASFDTPHSKLYNQQSLTIADPLWHHVTHESEELSFHVGDIIMVLDMRDKDWWWGRKASNNGRHFSDSSEYEETGWFPSTFVRLRANQAVTADELIEDIKQGTVDTASVVQHYSSSLLSRHQARCNVVNEIVTAERDYVKHLRDIVQGFIEKARERSEMFTESQIKLVFGNISEIYDVAQSFLESLEKCVADSESSVHNVLIGKCFLQHKTQFEVYSAYCNNHPRALEELQSLNKDSKYTQFFEACRLLQNMIKLPLDGFLLTPIQKICKYPLQLTELLKYTNPDHEDYNSLQEALVAMKDMAMLINERKRKVESIQKAAEWQNTVDDWQDDDILVASSELIHSGELSKLSSGGRLVERHFFLFDHQLVQCKKELLKKSLIYKSRVDLDTHSVVSIEDGKAPNSSTYVRNALELRDQEGTTVLILCAKSQTDKDKWLKCFSKERETVNYDKENGFAVTESFKALARLTTPTKSTKPNKSNSLPRRTSDSKPGSEVIDTNGKDKTNNNNKSTGNKQKTSSGLIHKLKRARIVT